MIIRGLPKDIPPESYLNLDFTLADACSWAPAGHHVAFGQVQLREPTTKPSWDVFPSPLGRLPGLELKGQKLLTIGRSTGSTWVFDLSLGTLTSWTRPERPQVNLLTEPLRFDLYRAPTDNDRGCDFGRDWLASRLHQAKSHVTKVTWEIKGGFVKIVSEARIAPPVLNWTLDTHTTFYFDGTAVRIHVKAKPNGLRLPKTFGRFGLSLALADCERVRWFGRGPGESYRDKKMSQAIGNWEEPVDNLFTDYEFPQDSGNRTDVRWVEFLRKGSGPEGAEGCERLIRASFGGLDGASFQALHYSTRDLDECTHPFELHKRKRKDTVVHLDWFHHGLGTGSCGPETLPQYQLRADQKFEAELLLE